MCTVLHHANTSFCSMLYIFLQSNLFKGRLPQLSNHKDWSNPYSQMAVTPWQLLLVTQVTLKGHAITSSQGKSGLYEF